MTDRQARWAVSALFFSNGAIAANLIPRLPEVKGDLGLSNTGFGLAVASTPIGALSAGLLAGVLIRRFGSAKVAVIGMIGSGFAVILAGAAPIWAVFALGLFLAGALDAVVDVAQNSHGLRVQRRMGRSILNSFHALWSIGAVTGGLMGAAAAGLGLPLVVHLAISGVLFACLNAVAYRYLLPGPEPQDAPVEAPATSADAVGAGKRAAARYGTLGALLALGFIVVAQSVVEDAGNNWATLYMGSSLGASASIAAFGFISLVGMQFIGRITGDSLVDRFGQRNMARFGGTLVAVGMGLALVWPSIPGSIIGFGAAGFGIATLVPAAMETADRLPGLKAGTGLTVVSWLLRVGFLLSPPVVGALADATSLRFGLIVIPLAGLGIVLAAGVLPNRSSRAAH